MPTRSLTLVLLVATSACAAAPRALAPSASGGASSTVIQQGGKEEQAAERGPGVVTRKGSCRPLSAEPLAPTSPYPGFWIYPSQVELPPGLRTRDFGYAPMHLVSTPDGPLALAISGLHGNPGMLIPLDGKAARVLRGEGTDFFRYVTNGREQTALIVAGGEGVLGGMV